MADNPTVDNGGLTDYTVATDDDGTAQHQYVKVEFGPDNTQTKVTTTTGLPTQGTGTAGTPAGGVVTVQGVTSMTALKVDGSATTQPVSGTVTAQDGGGSLTVDNAGTFAVQDSEKVADNAAFTDGTTKVLPAGFVFDEVAGTALTENDAAAARIDNKRAQVGVIEDATTRGQRAAVSAAGALKVDGSAVTQPVSGTVTANAGTNLNTSTLALEAGGNLAAAAASLSVIDDWDETDRAKVNPIVGQAGVQGGSGAVSAITQRVVLATDVALPAGTNAIGKLSANSGIDIGDVDVTSVVPGTGATNLGKAEDAVHGSGDTGVMALAVRNDAGTAFAADGDYVPLSVDSSGAVRVTGGGGGTQYTEDAAAAADPVGTVPILVRKDTPSATVTTDGDNIAQRGTNFGAAYVTLLDTGGSPVAVGGGTQYTEGDTDATITGTAMLWEDTSDTLRSVSAAKPLPVNIISGAGSGGTAIQDDSAFTVGTSNLTPAGGTYKSTRDAVDDNDAGAFAMTPKRAQYVTLETPNADSVMDDTLDAVKVVNATAANLNVTEASAASSLTSLQLIDDVVYTDDTSTHATGTSKGVGMMAAATPTDSAVNANDIGMVAMTVDRKLHVSVQDALPAGAAIIGALAANQSTNVAQMNGVAVTMGNGASGTGVQRVTLASDSTGQVAVASLPASTNTLEVVGDVAEDAVLSGNPIRVGGRASTATPSAMSADGDIVTTWLDRSGASVVTGYVAEDGALGGNPERIGIRAHSGVPTAMSADNDVVTPWADRSGAQVVIPQPRMVDIQGVSALGTSVDYSSGDFMGGVITFTSVALASGRPLQVTGAVILDRAIQSVALTLLLFRASPTVASADNAALSITAANASTARFLGTIKFAAADYVGATSCSFVNGTVSSGQPGIPVVSSGSANIFGVLVAGGTYNAAAAGDLEINLVCTQF